MHISTLILNNYWSNIDYVYVVPPSFMLKRWMKYALVKYTTIKIRWVVTANINLEIYGFVCLYFISYTKTVHTTDDGKFR